MSVCVFVLMSHCVYVFGCDCFSDPVVLLLLL